MQTVVNLPVDRQPPQTEADPYRTYRFAANVLGMLIFFIILIRYFLMITHPAAADFVSFWGAARLVLDGNPAGAYDYAILHPVQLNAAQFNGELPFAYPPIFLLVLTPFALLPYSAAITAWTVATFAGYIASARRLFPESRWIAAAYPPVLACAFVGQNAFFTACIFFWGLYLLPKRPFLAGLVLGCLVIKPQLGLLLPVALLAAQQWRAIAGAALSSVSAMVAGVLLFGASTTAAWLAQMSYFADIARTGTVGWHKLASVNAALRHANIDAAPAMWIHSAIALVAVAVIWRVWSTNTSWGAKGAALAAATMLISPYVYLYDSLILVICFLWLAQAKADALVLTTLWCVAGFILVQTVTAPNLINLNPLVPMTLLFLVCLQTSERPIRLLWNIRVPGKGLKSHSA